VRIPLLDLQAQYQAIKPEIDAAIQRVLDRGQFILGPEGEALEQEIAAFCGTKHAVGVASGTDALELSLRALGIRPGDEVITTAYSFFATAEAIVAVGAIPVFADIELATYNLDPEQAALLITPRTKAILPVHLYGHPCAIEPILALARTHRLKVVEDCAQAIGATYQDHRVGSFGDAGTLSFYPTKNLGGYGDGGMVVTNSADVADQVRLLRTHGSRGQYWHEALGKTSRLDELQAAILRVKLRHLDGWTQARRRCARLYQEALSSLQANGLVLPQELPGCTHVFHQYSIRLDNRDAVQQALSKQGIASQVYYPSTLPQQPALAVLPLPSRQFPNAEAACRTLLSLPIFPELTEDQLRLIVKAVADSLK